MKYLILSANLLGIYSEVSFAADSNAKIIPPEIKDQARKWISQQKTLGFQENKGQMVDINAQPVPHVLFKAEAPALNIWVTTSGLTYQFFKMEENGYETESEREQGLEGEEITNEWHRVDMTLKGAQIKKGNIFTEGDITQGEVNYYLGHCPNGIFNVKTYTKITIKEIYPGIDWILYTSGNEGLKHDFIVHPHADPGHIKLIYEGSGNFNITEHKIHFQNGLGALTEGELLCYQGNAANAISSQYSFSKSNREIAGGFSYEVTINLSAYDNTQSLTIDPNLVWATIYGGNAVDGFKSITVDLSGNIFITAYIHSANFPMLNAGTFYQGANSGSADAVILKFSNGGVRLWATYYGGGIVDYGNGITTDNSGNVWLTGQTRSTDFPVQNAGTYFQSYGGGGFIGDAYILKFDNTGNRLWATYYGGTGDEIGNSITIDNGGNVFITGNTASADFPVQNAGTHFQPTIGGAADAFIVKFDNAGNRLWSTFYGGSVKDQGNTITIDNSDNVWVTGLTASTNFPLQSAGTFFQPAYGGGVEDGFILKFDNAGNRLLATYYGGSGGDQGNTITTDNNNNMWVTGHTLSTDFPVQNAGTFFQPANGGGTDVYILKFDNAGNRLWATYYGGSGSEKNGLGYDSFGDIVTDGCGNVYVSFNTSTSNMSTQVSSCTTGGYEDASYNGGSVITPSDLFLVLFSNTGVRLWATYLGGNGNDVRESMAVDKKGNLFMAGEWWTSTASTYPFTDPGGGAYYDNAFHGTDDCFITKFVPVVITVQQTNATSCNPCNGSATVTVNNTCVQFTYTWSNGTTVGPTSNLTSTITNLCAGSYSVIVSSCYGSDTVFYTLTGPAIATNTITAAICQGDSILINGVYLGVSGTYIDTLLAAAANGCDSIINITLSVDSVLTASKSYSICTGSTYTLPGGTVVSTSGTYKDTLTFASGCDSIITTVLTVVPSLTASKSYSICTGSTYTLPGGTVVSASGTYVDTLTFASGCDSIITTTLTVIPLLTASKSYSICTGSTYTLPGGTVVSASGTYVDTLTFASGCDSIITTILTVVPGITVGKTASICAGSTYALPGGTVVSTGGTYIDTLSSASGCDSIITTTLSVSPLPPVTISPDITIAQGITITLNASGGGSYQWTTGEIMQNIIVSPVQTTTYCVTVTDNNGCTAKACVKITIEPVDCSDPGELYLPNAFSPNNDGENDILQIYYEDMRCVRSLQLTLYDRWGEKVFTTTALNFTWNGNYKGKIMSSAVFVYYLEAFLINGEQIIKQGNISLIK